MAAPLHMPHIVKINGFVIARCSCGALGKWYKADISGEYKVKKDAMTHVMMMKNFDKENNGKDKK